MFERRVAERGAGERREGEISFIWITAQMTVTNSGFRFSILVSQVGDRAPVLIPLAGNWVGTRTTENNTAAIMNAYTANDLSVS